MTTAVGAAKRPHWLAMGVVSLVLGLIALGSSLPLVMLDVTGWPWNSAIHEQAGQTRVELVHDNGKVETVSGSREEVEAWVSHRDSELKQAYGLDQKIALGRVLNTGGIALLVLGTGVLLWRLITSLMRRVPRRALT